MEENGVSNSESDSRAGIQVIARAASVLRSLKSQPEGLSLAQIAERVSLPRSTVQRIVAALQAERFVMAANPDRGIRLGPELAALAESARIDLVELIRPILKSLADETGETVDLAVLRGKSLIFVDQLPGTHRLRAVSFVGEAFPLTTPANGKACLALLPLDEAKALIKTELHERKSTRSARALLLELAAVRKSGIAFDLDEHSEGLSAAGFAFRDPSGGYWAVSMPTPSQRFKANRAAIEERLRKAQAQIVELVAQL